MKALYMENPSLLSLEATVTEVSHGFINDKNYWCIKLDQTIFHPKGGGQLADHGTIDSIPVSYVHKELPDKNRLDQFSVLHCFEEKPSFQKGDLVHLQVDEKTRLLHARLHTAGHLVAEATHSLFPSLTAIQGNHYPQDSYVRFKGVDAISSHDAKKIEETICEWIEQDLTVLHQILPNGLHAVKITDAFAPCGGTHVGSLKEVGLIEITAISVNTKEGKVTVKYQ